MKKIALLLSLWFALPSVSVVHAEEMPKIDLHWQTQSDPSLYTEAMANFLAAEIELLDGNNPQALMNYQALATALERILHRDNRSWEWKRDLALSYGRMADIQLGQNDVAAAIKSYQAVLQLVQKLATANPKVVQWQRALALNYINIGDAQMRINDVHAASKNYELGTRIREKLFAEDESNRELQRDLAVAYDRVGNALLLQENVQGALNFYQGSVVLRERLVTANPKNYDWQTELVVSCWKLGKLPFGLNEATQRGYLQRGLSILRNLHNSGALALDKTGWISRFESAIQTLSLDRTR